MTRGPYSYRSDPNVPAFPDDRPIIVYDGFCQMCSGWARFVLRHDRDGKCRVLSAQSAVGRALYVHYGLDPDDYETNIFIDEGTAWFKSEACIRMGLALGPPWSWARWFRIVPRSVRDAGYEMVARNRMRLMGRRNVCYVADAAHRARSLG